MTEWSVYEYGFASFGSQLAVKHCCPCDHAFAYSICHWCTASLRYLSLCDADMLCDTNTLWLYFSAAQVNKSHRSVGADGLIAVETAPGKGIISMRASLPPSAAISRRYFDKGPLRDELGEKGEAALEGAQQGTGTAGVCESGCGLVI